MRHAMANLAASATAPATHRPTTIAALCPRRPPTGASGVEAPTEQLDPAKRRTGLRGLQMGAAEARRPRGYREAADNLGSVPLTVLTGNGAVRQAWVLGDQRGVPGAFRSTTTTVRRRMAHRLRILARVGICDHMRERDRARERQYLDNRSPRRGSEWRFGVKARGKRERMRGWGDWEGQECFVGRH